MSLNDRGGIIMIDSITHQIPRHPVELRLSGSGSYGQVSNTERTYYIVPPGMNVIFRDEYGNELKRQAAHIFPVDLG
jgi:hypothetical protein